MPNPFGGLVPHMTNRPLGLVPHSNQAHNLRAKPISDPSGGPDPLNPDSPSLQYRHHNGTWDSAPTMTQSLDTNRIGQIYGKQMQNWAEWSVIYANQAGVDADMVLAMVLQEGAPLRTGYDRKVREMKGVINAFDPGTYEPDPNGTQTLLEGLANPSTYHPDPDGEKYGAAYDEARLASTIAGFTKHPDDPKVTNSIGLTNMKLENFAEVVNAYPDAFNNGHVKFSDLVGNDRLAIEAAAYNLKLLQSAAQDATPEVRASQPSLDQFLGSGFNAGGTYKRSHDVALGLAFFTGTPQNPGGPESNETEHGRSTVNAVLPIADQILYGTGAYE